MHVYHAKGTCGKFLLYGCQDISLNWQIYFPANFSSCTVILLRRGFEYMYLRVTIICRYIFVINIICEYSASSIIWTLWSSKGQRSHAAMCANCAIPRLAS